MSVRLERWEVTFRVEDSGTGFDRERVTVVVEAEDSEAAESAAEKRATARIKRRMRDAIGRVPEFTLDFWGAKRLAVVMKDGAP